MESSKITAGMLCCLYPYISSFSGVEMVGLNEGYVAQQISTTEGAVNRPPKGFIEPMMVEIPEIKIPDYPLSQSPC